MSAIVMTQIYWSTNQKSLVMVLVVLEAGLVERLSLPLLAVMHETMIHVLLK